MAEAPPGTVYTGAKKEQLIASNRRWRSIFGLLALVLPALLFGLFYRQELRLRALADHGEVGEAQVTRARGTGPSSTSFYEYQVGGERYDWSIRFEEAPYAVGQRFPIVYLPEDPALSRPGERYGPAELEAELKPGITRGAPIGLFLFLFACALLCHRNLVRLENDEPVGGRRISPNALGLGMAALILAALLSVELDSSVRAVQVRVLGAEPLGLPAPLVAGLLVAILYLPYFWVFPALMRIVLAAQAEGRGFGKAGIVEAVATAPAERKKDRNLVIFGLAYFVALAGAWIAYASHLGI